MSKTLRFWCQSNWRLYISFKNKLDIKKQPRAFIDVIEWEGTIPEARESASLCTYKDSIYLFGGVGAQKFDYFNYFDFNNMRWYSSKYKINVCNTLLFALTINQNH